MSSCCTPCSSTTVWLNRCSRDLLPLPASRTAAGLRRLQQAGLAELHDGRWQVAAPAYVPVRDLLASRDYLCDAF